jgi:hypothetical protein
MDFTAVGGRKAMGECSWTYGIERAAIALVTVTARCSYNDQGAHIQATFKECHLEKST